jgi:hypothetical protein
MGNVKHTYSQSVDAVYAKLTDPEHLRRRCEAAKHRDIDIQTSTRGDALEIRITRDIESEIPSLAKKVIDPVNRVSDVVEWRSNGNEKTCSYRVTVSKRISVKGEAKLTPAGSGCEYSDTFTATVDVPLIGRKIADLVEKETAVAIREDIAFTAKELAG